MTIIKTDFTWESTYKLCLSVYFPGPYIYVEKNRNKEALLGPRPSQLDRVLKKLNISEYDKTFSGHFCSKFKDFLLKKFFIIFQNGGDM